MSETPFPVANQRVTPEPQRPPWHRKLYVENCPRPPMWVDCELLKRQQRVVEEFLRMSDESRTTDSETIRLLDGLEHFLEELHTQLAHDLDIPF